MGDPLAKPLRRFAVLGNHLPRRCGIATFTTHLVDALTDALPDADGFVVAMNDAGRIHAYPPRVRFEIAQGDVASYRRAADFLNVNRIDVLSVQHEYGIFGGRAGAHLLATLRELRMPIVTTLHTILADPNASQRAVIDELAQLSARLVVMSAAGVELLQHVHGIPRERIDLIPHGIPVVPHDPQSKERLGVEGKTVILTFGLLSADKGIQYVIDALPAIVAAHPETVYVVLGATHPHVLEHEGEAYRLMLEARGERLGVANNLIFHNRFLEQSELIEFLSATDIYITPYLQPEQSTSGTLAYAVGAGKAVVSTPYTYARELLADGRGVLVPWRDSSAIAGQIVSLIGDQNRRERLSDRAAAHGAAMTWTAVGKQHADSLLRARTDWAVRRHASFHAATVGSRPLTLPDLNLAHVRTMTDGTGILQHATFNVPRYGDGYCLDDNARALLLMTLLDDAGVDDPVVIRSLSARYLAFVSYAFDRGSRRFRNFLSYDRRWTESRGSEDSHGRALWALGAVVGRASDPGQHSLAGDLFHAGTSEVQTFTSPRAWAYVLLGIEEYLRAFQGDSAIAALRDEMAARLLDLFERTKRPEWPWFESSLTYCNARLPQALIAVGVSTGRRALVDAGLESLEWLSAVQVSPEGHFAAIGSNGFYERGAVAAVFDQQPVEACASLAACLEAHRATGDLRWIERGRRAFGWFLGQNHLQQWLFDPATGGCRDGVHPDRLNQNQGAESTLSFLLARHELGASIEAPVPQPISPLHAECE
jgi:glycosyltransferase involved in cell wall biosynthesis